MVQAGKEAAFGIQSIHNPASDFTPRGDGKWWRSLREGTAAPRGAVGCCGREAILPPASSPQSRPTSNQRRRGAVDRPPIPHPETSPLAPAGSIPEVRGAARTTGRNRASLPPHAAGPPPTHRSSNPPTPSFPPPTLIELSSLPRMPLRQLWREMRATPFSALLYPLDHFHVSCIPYSQWRNQAEAFCEVMVARASVTAFSRTSTVRALAERSDCLIFPQHFSMGLKSGE